LGAMIFKAVTSYRGECFQVPTRLTTVTHQTGEYKVDLTCHPKFPSSRFPHRIFFFSQSESKIGLAAMLNLCMKRKL
jgi:hypothetical protein